MNNTPPLPGGPDDVKTHVLGGHPPQECVSGKPNGAADHPSQVGRYRIEKVLDEGGSGRVYLAHDDQLHRLVAVKMKLVQAVEAQDYLDEARVLASLDHPHIVPVYDVGITPSGYWYIVSKVIEGSALAKQMREARLTHIQAAGLVATVAEALDYAHRKGLVHRDIKPGNILLDKKGVAYVADFGLALKEEDVGKGGKYVGTPGYMSPEQARGEAHRVDGRSDIFSLGVVFYELLTGQRLFHSGSILDMLALVLSREVRPLRQVDATIPQELERICLKALSRRASDRYGTAQELGEDLRCYLAPPTPMRLFAETKPIKIVPKSLRSFDARDADFFLELLPGPRDRHGLPGSLRFWKTRIEEMDADATFAVGLVYGPSGCGKSSLVKAGLLPILAGNVIPVYVEADAQETETRLLNGLRKNCPDLQADLALNDALGALRRGQGIPADKKVLIVLDQFEQWLHARGNEENAQLVQALRQCDGGRLQCMVMVRDDFWLAVSRFMKAMEIDISEGRNSALVDLFDLMHARKVLAAFGSAYGRLPEDLEQCTPEQEAFLDQASRDLSQEGKIIPVRLALFAEMIKGKSWTLATLAEVGGIEGVGVTFLEETFNASHVATQHRVHQRAAQAVLNALLPAPGTDLKGHMRSREELLEASGYADRPDDFDDLLRILDVETRLITPTDPEGKEDVVSTTFAAGAQCYQLTHDYLVQPLRTWLTQKQKESSRGRAELLLADRSAAWNARPENRLLPSLLQWLQIRLMTAKKNWSGPERRLMQTAARYHALRVMVAAMLIALLTLTGLMVRDHVVEQRNAAHASALVQRLLDAETAQVPGVITQMDSYRRWTDPLLHEACNMAPRESRPKLHASLALLPVDPAQVDFLCARLLAAEPHEVRIIRDALDSHKGDVRDRLWAAAKSPEKGKESQRLCAASALALYDAESAQWTAINTALADDLVKVPAVHLSVWIDALRPVRTKLLSPLALVFQDPARRDAERSLATDILADYAADQPKALANLLMDADARQFAVLFPKFKEKADAGLPTLMNEIERKLPSGAKDSDIETLAKRQANAAVVLVKLGQPDKVWPLLKHSPDPRLRSYLLHRMSPLSADPKVLVHQLESEPDVSIRRALLLGLGTYGDNELTSEMRTALLPRLQKMYRTDRDPGLHAAAEWLLRTWKQEAWVKQTNQDWVDDWVSSWNRQIEIRKMITTDKPKPPPQWYVNYQGQTMVVIPGPVQFMMGEQGSAFAPPHQRRINRTFSIAAKAVTIEQFRRFEKQKLAPEFERSPDQPILGIDWYRAAKYCNWLSKQEAIPPTQWCYEIKGDDVHLKADYLSLSGYRLPSEAEMEYATRAETLTARYFGETDELLMNYEWYVQNSHESTRPVGSLMPNDFGLFDTLGNSLTWCQESSLEYPKGKSAIDDKEDVLTIEPTQRRVVRGGAFDLRALNLRSSQRFTDVPGNSNHNLGFRVARTIPPPPAD